MYEVEDGWRRNIRVEGVEMKEGEEKVEEGVE